jgi:transcriptional regulator with XRE-family HTH domain
VTAENDGDERLDPAASTLAHFGHEVRLERERHRVTQMQLAKEAHCHYTLVQKIETAKRIPSLDFAQTCDRVFTTNGRFERLWPLVIKFAFPAWFRPFVALEEQADAIQAFELQLITGLLQTEGYARAIFTFSRPDDLDALVAARMQRQRILAKPDRPHLWVILTEAALRRPIGGSAVMREQLTHILSAMEHPRTVVQVIPTEVAAHPALGGCFHTLSFEDGSPSAVYVDGFPQGYLSADPDHVRQALRAYDLLRATALPIDASADLIAAIAKEQYT